MNKHLVTLVLSVSCALAQSAPAPSAVRKVSTSRQGGDLRVEILLSAPVQPSIETAVNPDRILLDFPGVIDSSSPNKVPVNSLGVLRVRAGQHTATPPVTRIVLDLDQVHPYTMKVEGNRIIVTVSPVENASNAASSPRSGAPAPAMSGGLTGLFRHKPEAPPAMTADRAPAIPPAAPPVPALNTAPAPATTSAPATVATATPTPAPAAQDSSTGPVPSFSPTVAAGGAKAQSGEVAPAGFPSATAGTPGTPSGTVATTTFDAKADATPNTASDVSSSAAASAAASPAPVPEKTTEPALQAAATAPPVTEQAAVTATAPTAATPAAAAPQPSPIASAAAAAPAPTDSSAANSRLAGAAAVPTETAAVPVPAAAVPAPAVSSPVPAEPAPSSTVAGAAGTPVEATPVEATPVEATPVPTDAASTDAAAANPDAVPVEAIPVAPEAMVMARSDDPGLRTVFKVKYVADGVAYLEGGRAQGLTEGMKLQVEETNLPTRQGASAHAANDPRVVAELEVSGLAETSAVTEIHDPKRAVKAGDLAYLSRSDTESMVQQRTLSSTRQYPAVISFTEGDTLDEEARAEVPRPPSPAVNRARGRIGLDYNSTTSYGASSVTSANLGFSFRGDITRIGGTYWNLSGYYRGRFTKQAANTQQTLQDLINHTYHLNLSYENPNSRLVAGVGRLYLPWASSLDTIDGGYFGVRLRQGATIGVFGGSTPDPTSWNYAPNRAISGTFVNFEGGSYEHFHYTSTSGGGVSMINWAVDRPFLFFEDSLSYGHRIGLYEAAQIDSPSGNQAIAAPGFGLGRSFFTLRVQPMNRVELNFNHNYFRDVPTFDPALLGTTLLDKFLFQGFSAGARVEVLKQVFLSTTLGRSNRSGDASASLNQMYGITFNRLPLWRLRADAHYSKFNSSFGSGTYESVSLSRQISDTLRMEFLGGQQDFTSSLTSSNKSRFFTSTIETTLGPHYYTQGNFTVNRGEVSYNQWLFSFGYRFDNRTKGR